MSVDGVTSGWEFCEVMWSFTEKITFYWYS